MTTPNGQQGPYGPNPYQPGQQPSQVPGGQQETRSPGDDIPRQQDRREDQYDGPGQEQPAGTGQDQYAGPGQGQYPGQDQYAGAGQVPGQDGGWNGGPQGTYSAYPGGSGYAAAASRQLTYLEGAPVDFPGAIRGAIGNMFTLRGRASRSAFWWFFLLQAVSSAIIGWIYDASTAAGIVLYIVVALPLLIASIFLAVRRLHDSDHTGWWWWIGFIPVIGTIVLLVFYLLRSTPGPNRYSPARTY